MFHLKNGICRTRVKSGFLSCQRFGFCTVSSPEEKKRLVILGTGWASVSLLKKLDVSAFKTVTVVSPRNYFLFTPLLPGVTVGTNEPRSIIEPIRKLITWTMKRHPDAMVQYLEMDAMNVDLKKQEVICENQNKERLVQSKSTIPFDQLVVAVGAQPSTFNIPGVEKYCYFLKEISHARKIRTRLMDAFEMAACIPNEEDKKRILSFVVVGGGPTGVEFAAELRDFIHEDVSRYYPEVAHFAKVSIVQGGGMILNTFDEEISKYAAENFRRIDIDLLLNKRVQNVSATHVTVVEHDSNETSEIPYGICVWAAGVAPREVTRNIIMAAGQEELKRPLLVTDPFLRVIGADDKIFALGDCSMIDNPKLASDASFLFQKADVDRDERVSLSEFSELAKQLKSLYPLLNINNSLVDQIFNDYRKGKQFMSKQDFEEALREVESGFRTAPATAQVASQQGEWLAKYLTGKINTPWHRVDLGMMSYVGGSKAVIQNPFTGATKGVAVFSLWRGVYASKMISWRTLHLVLWDWFKAKIYGREISKI